MNAPNLVRAVDILTEALETEVIDYVIGGAVALAYWTGPRATIDIDITVDVDIPTILVQEALVRKKRVPFGDRQINVMSPEDVLILKVLFGRTKDFADIERLLAMRSVDNNYVDRW